MSFDINLREYQSESVEQLREGIRQGKKNQVLCSPTGSGKTVIGAYLLDECREKKKTAIFVVERVSLIGQTSTMLDSFGIDHGVIQGNHWRTRPGERIQVATAQSLRARGWPQADLILVDECHVMMADTLERIKARDCVTIGLTATPFSKGMGKHYDGIVNVTTMDELINKSFLVPPKIYAASEPDMRGAKTVAGEWTDAEAETQSSQHAVYDQSTV
jgi:superfamily II DNA or RNA helicase